MRWSFRRKMVLVGLMTAIPLTVFTVAALFSNTQIAKATEAAQVYRIRHEAIDSVLTRAQALFTAGDGLLWDAEMGNPVKLRRLELAVATQALSARLDALAQVAGGAPPDPAPLRALATFARDELSRVDSSVDVPSRRAAATQLRALGEPAVQAILAAADESLALHQQAVTETEAAVQRSSLLIGLSYALILLISVPLVTLVIRSVIRMVANITDCMATLAAGHVAVSVPHADRVDEIGRMAAAIQVFKDTAAELAKMHTLRAQQRQDFMVKREMLALNDALDGEAQFTVGRVATDAAEVIAVAGRMRDAAELMGAEAQSVEREADHATANVDAVAAATEQLASSSREIAVQVNGASRIAAEAVVKAQLASQTIQGMAAASDEIGQVLALITNIAAQTNLLALNATIEAARAGEAGKGFAVVASEVKILATQTAHATDQITTQMDGIATVSRNALAAIDGMSGIIARINEAAMVIAAAVEEQGAATQNISDNAHQAAGRTRQVSNSIGMIVGNARDSGGQAVQVDQMAATMAQHLTDLQERLRLILSQTASMTASRSGPLPVDLPVALVDGGQRQPCRVVDVTLDEALMPQPPRPLTTGQTLDLDVPEVGRVPATVTHVDGRGATLRLQPSAATRKDLDGLLSGYLALDAALIAAAKHGAAQVAEALGREIGRGGFTLDDLFDEDYRPVPGSTPAQFMTRFVAATDRLLPDIQEPILAAHAGAAFAAAVDRNGFLPTHNRRYSQPQGGDPVWNNANCRNRRIFNDRTGLSAGRNTQPYLLQSYLRDMGGGHYVMMQDISAPIVVKGRHWGGFRIGYSVK